MVAQELVQLFTTQQVCGDFEWKNTLHDPVGYAYQVYQQNKDSNSKQSRVEFSQIESGEANVEYGFGCRSINIYRDKKEEEELMKQQIQILNLTERNQR